MVFTRLGGYKIAPPIIKVKRADKSGHARRNLIYFVGTLMIKTGTQSELRFDAVSFSIFALGELLGKTWDYALTGQDLDLYNDAGKGRIYCLWHAHLLPIAYGLRRLGTHVIVSESGDGRRAAAVASRWG